MQDIYEKIGGLAEKEALKLLDRADREYRAHPLWGLLGMTPEAMHEGLERWLARAPIPKDRLAEMKQKLESEMTARVPEVRMVRASSLAGLKFINHLRV